MVYAALVLLMVAVLVLWISGKQRKRTGLPSGRVIYTDTDRWGRVEKPLYDPILGLTGKPDYLVEEKGVMIPVEVKSARAPAIPHDSHVYQLAAYCMLVESTYGARPPYGILRYRDKTFSIDYTPTLEAELEDLLDAIRAEEKRNKKKHADDGPDRSHNEPVRCARCGYRGTCDQRL